MPVDIRRLVCFGLVCAISIGVRFVWPAPAQASDTTEGSAPLGKLPADVAPTHYALDLTVIPSRERFSGRVAIDVTLAARTDLIWLHGRDIDPKKVFILDSSGARIPARYEEVDDTGVARLQADRPVGPGAVKLIIQYEAPFNRSLRGLYRVDARDKSYAYTQFQALSARRAFPSFDEPRFKTPFDITLTVQSDHSAISNTAEQTVVALDGGLKRFHFKTTRPLPTYLIAVAVGDFDVVEWDPIPVSIARDREIPLRGIAVKVKGARLRYALEHTAAMIGILEAYFGIPYPYDKLDLIAAAEFGGGGMENAGAIIYRESLILFNDQPSIYQKRAYAYVHAHELAHHWFGNLVTPEWWDDLWLNEAFATWMAGRVIHAWRPDDYDDRHAVRRAQWAMRADRLASARQIRQPILSNHDIANAFDRITYSKGGAILAMFERFMGAEAFRSGIRRYLKRFPHGSATAGDLMRSLSESTGDTRIISAFRSFLEQPGVPLLNIEWSCDATGRTRVAIEQSRYLPLGSKGSKDHRWQIPACLAYEETGKRKQHCDLLTEVAETVDLPTTRCPRWVMPNAEGAGYYHWVLNGRGLRRLLGAMDRLSERELLSMMGSLSAAYNAGMVDLTTYLEAVRVAARSQSWDVVKAPMQDLRNIKDVILPETLRARAKALYARFYGPALARLGLTDGPQTGGKNTSNAALLRGDLIWFLALDAEDAGLRHRLSRLGQAYLGYGSDSKLHPERVHPNLIRVSLIVATQELGRPFFDTLVAHLDNASDAVFRSNVISALAFQTDPVLSARVRALIVQSKLKKRDASHLLYRHARRIGNRDAVWQWVTAHFDDILRRIPRSHHRNLPWRASRYCSLEKRDEIRSFFEPRIGALEGGPRTLANVVESIEICAAIVGRQRPDAAAYFRHN